MTLSTMLCKSASSLVPLTSQLVGRVNRHYHHSAVFTASNHPNWKQISSSFNVPVLHLSTASATTKTMKPSADESVLRVLNLEIKSALETNKDHDRVEESTPSEFPFKIEDNPGQYTAILTREYRGELIKVEAHMPTSSTTGGDHYCHPIKMVINISKNDRPSLEFTCIGQLSKNDGPFSEFTCDGTLYPVSILEFSVKNSENSSEDSTIKNSAQSENSKDDQMPFEGPNFYDLDKNLKEAFHRYLDAKGINAGFIGFLYEYMRNKCTREHLIWLKKMKNFIEV